MVKVCNKITTTTGVVNWCRSEVLGYVEVRNLLRVLTLYPESLRLYIRGLIVKTKDLKCSFTKDLF